MFAGNIQSLKGTKTEENLMRAFAGESQARNRYTFAAGTAKENRLYAAAELFLFTAGQEKEHAEIFYGFLKEGGSPTVYMDGGYPVDSCRDIQSLLKAASHNEYEEYNDIYKAFGETAEQEGFKGIAQTFRNIAAIEKTHSDRFAYFAKLMEENRLFVSDVDTGFVCLNCGHVYYGKSAPEICPVCKHDRGYFIRIELLSCPYTKNDLRLSK
ncbi:MAG: rubrerythrin family protein [Clostridia bacterium]|nr:rubrerythrin family protein [Clostridia bacterium]